MKLTLIASAPLRPCLERMIPLSPHEIEPVFLPFGAAEPSALTIQGLAGHSDALLLADGAELLPDDGLTAGNCPIVLPRVHNCVSLLLGGAARYRRLFSLHGGDICWRLPLLAEELFFTPRAGCSCLCYLADTALGLPDQSLAARAAAQENGWDYREEETDLSLLERLLAGDWDAEGFVVVPAGRTARLTYTQELFSAV